MSALTSPDNIVYWTTAPIDPASLVAESAAQATSIQNALLTRQGQYYRWANSAARTAQTGMVYGSKGFQVDTGIEYFYDGTNWVIGARVNVQADTTNSVGRVVTQIGTGRITGVATANITEAVTFPVAFTSVPVITGGYIGGRTPQGGAFNDVGLVDVAPPTIGKVYSPSATGFSVAISRTDAAVLSATYDYYYSWTAMGTV